VAVGRQIYSDRLEKEEKELASLHTQIHYFPPSSPEKKARQEGKGN